MRDGRERITLGAARLWRRLWPWEWMRREDAERLFSDRQEMVVLYWEAVNENLLLAAEIERLKKPKPRARRAKVT